MNKTQIEHYFGITDNEDINYKAQVIAEYEEMKPKYPNLEFALTEDLGVYVPYNEIVATGNYISAFR